VVVNSFSFHGIDAGIVRVLDAENAVDAVAAADSAFGSVHWITGDA